MPIETDRKRVLMQWYDGQMLPDEIIKAMTEDQHWFPHRKISRGGDIRRFEPSPQSLPKLEIHDAGRVLDFYDYFSVNCLAGIIILKDGKLVYETYQRGMRPDTLWHSCSMAKSISSTLVGIALKEGAIASLDDPIGKYLDAGDFYSTISLRHLLRMNTGAKWNEDYGDTNSERRRLLDIQTEWRRGGILDFMRAQKAGTPIGTSWAYNTGESYLVGAVMEAATGMRLADYLSQKLWSRIGAEHDARWWCESEDGMTVSGSGMNASLMDYARFGQFVLEDGKIGGEQLLPPGWRDEAGAPFDVGGARSEYGYMWWIPKNEDPVLTGSFQAEGVYGQFIHINPKAGLVVALGSMRSKPGSRRRFEIDDDAFFAALAKAL